MVEQVAWVVIEREAVFVNSSIILNLTWVTLMVRNKYVG